MKRPLCFYTRTCLNENQDFVKSASNAHFFVFLLFFSAHAVQGRFPQASDHSRGVTPDKSRRSIKKEHSRDDLKAETEESLEWFSIRISILQ